MIRDLPAWSTAEGREWALLPDAKQTALKRIGLRSLNVCAAAGVIWHNYEPQARRIVLHVARFLRLGLGVIGCKRDKVWAQRILGGAVTWLTGAREPGLEPEDR